MNTNLNVIIENVSRHLVCGLAALIAGGIALSVAAGPVEAKSSLPVAAKAPAQITIAL
ncbi:hypothetical protein [Pedomonas mirosovicensis]|uniref:hypothetical protein n=1 Tax=Pedomonas mirosovicensis TaxID=2908641 RepID=UPI0021687BDA|nr:hypothetical protein [Pedomonas mirosovicensis]MCH8686058.1 hypothetical protein [Pedomonas mirosovicensis]